MCKDPYRGANSYAKPLIMHIWGWFLDWFTISLLGYGQCNDILMHFCNVIVVDCVDDGKCDKVKWVCRGNNNTKTHTPKHILISSNRHIYAQLPIENTSIYQFITSSIDKVVFLDQEESYITHFSTRKTYIFVNIALQFT